MMNFSHDVVICTSKRTDSLFKTIRSFEKHLHSPHVRLHVVINGTDEQLKKNLRELVALDFPEAHLLESGNGLASARNFALKATSGEIVTFLDDDVTLEDDFFDNLDSLFERDKNLIGAAPRIKDLYGKRPIAKICKSSPWLYRIILNFKLSNYGKVTRWGTNHWFPDVASNPKFCDWLPGCCMSYQRDKIGSLEFNEYLQDGPTRGYALGEDVDFSLRAALKGKLLFNSNDVIEHHQAPSVRDNKAVMELARGFWVGFLHLTYPDRFSKNWIIAFNLFKSLIFCIKFKPSKKNITENKLFFTGFYEELRFRKVGFPT